MPNESDAVPNPVRNIGKVQKFAVGTDFEAYAEQLEKKNPLLRKITNFKILAKPFSTLKC